jgi:hypothetical protein
MGARCRLEPDAVEQELYCECEPIWTSTNPIEANNRLLSKTPEFDAVLWCVS